MPQTNAARLEMPIEEKEKKMTARETETRMREEAKTKTRDARDGTEDRKARTQTQTETRMREGYAQAARAEQHEHTSGARPEREPPSVVLNWSLWTSSFSCSEPWGPLGAPGPEILEMRMKTK